MPGAARARGFGNNFDILLVPQAASTEAGRSTDRALRPQESSQPVDAAAGRTRRPSDVRSSLPADGAAAVGRAPPGHRPAPRPRPASTSTMAARQGRPRGDGLPRGGERLRPRQQAAHLADLRQPIFEEIKARTRETDLSVPTRNRGYWYYGRSFEGKEYGASCRVPVAGPDDWTPPQPGRGLRPRPARAARRGAAARPRRPGRGSRVLLPRRLLGQPGRPPAGLLHRHRRRRALHRAGQRPGHRRGSWTTRSPASSAAPPGAATAATSTTRPSTSRGAPTRSGGTGSAPTRPTTSWSTTRRTAGSGSASAAAAPTGS